MLSHNVHTYIIFAYTYLCTPNLKSTFLRLLSLTYMQVLEQKVPKTRSEAINLDHVL